jgi:hypothetical protein
MKILKEVNSSKSSTIKIEEDDPPGTGIKISGIELRKMEPEKGLGSFFIEKNKPNISYKVEGDNLKIKVFDKPEFSVNYPQGILSNFSGVNKKTLLDNFIYTRTVPLAIFANTPLHYQASEPFLKSFVDAGVVKDLPRISDETKIEAEKLSKNFLSFKNNKKIIFEENNFTKKLLPDQKTSNKKLILSLSFGRDSLLSYGVIKELGLECYPVFVNDMEKYNKNESEIKKGIISSFSEDLNQSIFFFNDDTDNIFRNQEDIKGFSELDSTNAMLSFALELIPLAYHNSAKYIVFGNERNLSDFFMNKEKLRVYPSYDQASVYMKKKNEYLKRFTNDNIQIVSFVEPLYNLAEVKILHHRYPHLLKYIASCFSKKLTDDRWCSKCHTCASAYLSAAAVNGNMKELSIKNNLFEKEYKNLYTLLSSKAERIYEKPPRVKEEQLLAFLLAYKNGYKGGLIDLFKKKYLKTAEKREAELRRKFFGIYPAHSIPKEIRNKVLNIYRQELKNLS